MAMSPNDLFPLNAVAIRRNPVRGAVCNEVHHQIIRVPPMQHVRLLVTKAPQVFPQFLDRVGGLAGLDMFRVVGD